MMIKNTSELSHEILENYVEKMQKMFLVTRTQQERLVASSSVMKGVNSFIERELNKEIESQCDPKFSQTLMIAACIIAIKNNIAPEELFHMVNILSRCMDKPLVENIYFDNFIGWVEYFFPYQNPEKSNT